MNEDKSARYHRLKRRVGVLSLAWSAAFLLTLAGTGASLVLRDRLAPLTSSGFVLLSLYVVTLAMIHEVGAFPLAVYGGYVLEHRYGLSRQTLVQWLTDHLKGALLGGVFGLGLILLVYWMMERWPEWWWLIAAMAFSVLLVLLANIAPVLLLPLFFKFRPLQQSSLRERLERLAERAGARVVGVYQWDLGQKTAKANAALTGIGGTRRILIADTMLDQYSDDEIEVVLAHELAHHVHGDIWSGILLEAGLTLVGFYAAHRLLIAIGPRLGVTGLADPAGVPLLLIAAGAVSVVLMPFALALSRAHERRADRFALDLTRNPGAFSAAMRRLAVQNLAEARPSRIVQWLFYSHPPLEERLANAARWAAVGELGRPGAA
jgi:STE24 endopeptidase